MSFERTSADIWGTRLSEAECPRRGEAVCLRPQGRVYRIERSELAMGYSRGLIWALARPAGAKSYSCTTSPHNAAGVQSRRARGVEDLAVGFGALPRTVGGCDRAEH
jgi:hypothetical protein